MQSLMTRYYQPLFVSLLAIVIGLAFYTGYLQGQTTEEQKVTLSCNNNMMSQLSIPVGELAQGNEPAAANPTSGAYVGSKNGTKYYSADCSAVQRIKPANYIWFTSAQDAQIQGYTPGKC